ncbi:hypothetical protein K8I61_00670 [bacterium]|nr:hypothetical protein [bacterium]
MTGDKRRRDPSATPAGIAARRAAIWILYVQGIAFYYYWDGYALAIDRTILLVLGLWFARYRTAFIAVFSLLFLSILLRVVYYMTNVALYNPWMLAGIAAFAILSGAAAGGGPSAGKGRRQLAVTGMAGGIAVPLLAAGSFDIDLLGDIAAAIVTLPALLIFARPPGSWRRWFVGAFVFLFGIQSVFMLYKFSLRPGLSERLAETQPEVTRLFAPDMEGMIYSIVAIVDLDHAGRLAVLPNKGCDEIVILRNGKIEKIIELGTETSNVAFFLDGKYYLDNGGMLSSLDPRTLELRQEMRLSKTAEGEPMQSSFMHHDDARRRLYACDYEMCNVVDTRRFEEIFETPIAGGFGVALPIKDGGEFLVTTLAWKGRRVRIFDADTFELLRERTYFDPGYVDAAVSPRSGRIYLSSMLLGRVMAVDPDTLEPVEKRWLSPGLWNAVVDPRRPYLYSFNYHTGEITVLTDPGLQVIKQFSVGPNLRAIHLDAAGDRLLAGSKAGGFAIDLTGLP